MKDMEPDSAFIDRLESRIVREVRRRNGEARTPPWALWTHARLAVAVVAAMVAGGAVVAAAYEAQQNQARNEIAALVEERAALARERLAQARQDREAARKRLAVGVGERRAVLELDVAVAEAEADVARIALDLEEVRLTGREPRREISAPRVSDRDFVTERLRADLPVPAVALEAAEQAAADVRRRVDVGTRTPLDLEDMQRRLLDIQAGRALIAQKLEIRRQFVAGTIDGTGAELRVLVAEAEQAVATLTPQLDLAQRTAAGLAARIAAGAAHETDVSAARARLAQLRADLSEAQLDLAIARKRLDERSR